MKVRLVEVARESRESLRGSKGGLPIVGLEHLTPGELTLTEWDVDSENTFTKVFRKGQMLFGRRRAYLQKAAVAPFDGICSGDITVIEAFPDKLVPELLPFIIQNDAFFDYAVGKSAGSLSPRAKWEHLQNFEFTLPPLAEQRKLANLLWAATAMRESYKKLLAATDELIKSQFVEMFGDPVKNSKGWPTVPLNELGDLNRGVSKHRPRNAPALLGGDYPLVQTGEIAAADLYVKSYTASYSEIGLQQSRMWPKGTLCITIAANIAKTAILDFDACFPDSVVGFIAGEKTNQLFVYFWFSFFQKLLEEQAPESAQKNINLRKLRELQIILPPLAIQTLFADFVKQADKSKFELQRAIDELEATYKSLLRENLG